MLPGSPARIRSPLGRLTSPSSPEELDAMRRRVWREQGIVSLAADEILDPWLRQAIVNEATKRWGSRNGGHRHGR